MNDKSDKPAPPAGGATPPSGPSDQNSKAKASGPSGPAGRGDDRRQDAPPAKREGLAFGTRRPDSAPIDPSKQTPIRPFGDKVSPSTSRQQPGQSPGKTAPAAGRPAGNTMAGPARATAQKAQSLEERLKAQPVEQRRRPTTGPGNGNVPLTSSLDSVRKGGAPGAGKARTQAAEGKTAGATPMKSPPQPAAKRGPGRAAILGMLFVTAVVVVGAIYTSDLLREEQSGAPDSQLGATEETADASNGSAPAGEAAAPAGQAPAGADASAPSGAASTEAGPEATETPSDNQGATASTAESLPPPPPPPAQEDVAAIPPPPAAAGDLTAADRLELEQLLARLDMSPGTVDGVIDDDTQAAIRLYQEFAGLPVDGEASPELLDDLRDVARMVPDSN